MHHITQDKARSLISRFRRYQKEPGNPYRIETDEALTQLISAMSNGIAELKRIYNEKLNASSPDAMSEVQQEHLQVTIPVNSAMLCIHRGGRADNDDLFNDAQYGPSVNVVRGHTNWNGT